MPLNGSIKKTSKPRSRFTALMGSRKLHDFAPAGSQVQDVPDTSVPELGTVPVMTDVTSAMQGTDDRQTMQLSFIPMKAQDELPTYPVADTIAWIFILINFPTILVTATHLLFSYREHIAAPASSSTVTTPPLSLILFIDVIVVLFTAIILPSVRNMVTNLSHIVIAVSLSGATWRTALPFAIGMSALSLSVDYVKNIVQTINEFILRNGRWLGSPLFGISFALHKLWEFMTEPARVTGNPLMGYARSAFAIHVLSIGSARVLHRWWTRGSPTIQQADPEHAQSSTTVVKPKKKSFTQEPKANVVPASVWEHFLRWRAYTSNKENELTTVSVSFKESNVCIGEIASRYIVFVVKASFGETQPTFTMQVNGLPWDAKIEPLQHSPKHESSVSDATSTTEWTIYVDNLSPKTEYDFALQFTSHFNNLGRHLFAICTSAKEFGIGRNRGDSYLLPPINTNASEDLMLGVDGLTHPTGPLSPVTTLEETIANASERLEEKKTLLKRTRKDYTKKLQMLQKDVDHLALRINGGVDKNEQRMHGRILSLQTEIKRIQDAIEEMEMEKEEIIKSKDVEHKMWLQEKSKRDHKAELLNDARRRFDNEKSEHQKRFSYADSEALRIRAKADKLSLRRTKIQQDLDRLSNEQDRVLDREFRDRVSSREHLNNERLQLEAQYLKSILELSQRAELIELYGTN